MNIDLIIFITIIVVTVVVIIWDMNNEQIGTKEGYDAFVEKRNG